MSDLALARRLLAGEELAFEEFFARFFAPVYRFALARLGGNEDAAEDAVQRTLIRAVNRLHTYRGEAALLTWICAICRHEIVAALEREGRSREVSIDDDRAGARVALDALAAPAADDPEAALRRRELTDLVRLTLDYLPERYGDVLEWKYIQELPVDEIARRLGVGYKAAESTLTRAREAFRDAFSFVAVDWFAPAARPGSPSSEGS